MRERITDPNKIPVQLNVKVPFEFRELLYSVAKRRKVSLTDLVYDVLRREFAPTHEELQQETRQAGATK